MREGIRQHERNARIATITEKSGKDILWSKGALFSHKDMRLSMKNQILLIKKFLLLKLEFYARLVL